jgi:3-isopropylmalate/(R)-2-methylmalate dehydratase small subunit
MRPFLRHTGLVVPLDRLNVDTDQIVPKQFCKLVTREGYGRVLFYDWRYLPGEVPNPDFILNCPAYQGASILLARANFGCGSSREHAPWALVDYGLRAIVAPSFADIFYNNCLKNGLLPVTLPEAVINELFARAAKGRGYELKIDLENQTVADDGNLRLSFPINSFSRKCLLRGLDDIELISQYESEITNYENRCRPEARLYAPIDPLSNRDEGSSRSDLTFVASN